MATLKRFARQAGFSETGAGQLAPCRRTSTRLNYQALWGKFRKWCKDSHHRSSEPTIPKIMEFFNGEACCIHHQGLQIHAFLCFQVLSPGDFNLTDSQGSYPFLRDLSSSSSTSVAVMGFGQGTGVLVRAPTSSL